MSSQCKPISTATEGDTNYYVVIDLVCPFGKVEYRKVVALLNTTKPLEKMMFLVEQLKISDPKVAAGNINKCFMENKIPPIWRPSHNIVIWKSGKACNSKDLPTISIVCQTYKLYERMRLKRIAPTIELHLIKEQAGFRAGKSFTSQLLNIIQHIQDVYQESMITGTGSVDPSAAKDTVT